MANRLADSSSPYLLQHRDNPIDWYPWGDEAWARAREEGKPVFLSVGYSSCHWCHVMAHESFEDAQVAEALNRDFVSIKLDREERPDVDEVYMTAVQMATGHGGWPMSLFLTPEKKPFFAGTYFPKHGRGEHPGFLTIVASLARAWRDQREEVEKSADDFARALAQSRERSMPGDPADLSVSLLDHAVEALHETFDFEHGGFGDRPKFPPHSALRFLIDYTVARPSLADPEAGHEEMARTMVRLTLEGIARGGIHDHVGGGIHRYSTDERWHLPHFEKMLYDNAQLLGSLGHARRAGIVAAEGLIGRFESGIVGWLRREMLGEDGALFSALDADAGGEEGLTYLWRVDELQGILGERAERFVDAFQCSVEGNYVDEAKRVRTGLNVLHLSVGASFDFGDDLERLLAVRSAREQPGLDDKAVAAWNGLAIAALAESGSLDLARRVADAWAQFGLNVPHMVTRGVAAGSPFLDDLACLADGYLSMAEAGVPGGWRELASGLVDRMVDEFRDPDGGFRFVGRGGEPLFGVSKPYMDNATPSPNGMAVRVLRRVGRVEEAVETLVAGLGWVLRVPTATETLLREATALMVRGIVVGGRVGSAMPPIMVWLDPPAPVLTADGWAETEVVIELPPEFHINSHQPPTNWLVPTTVRIEGVFGEAGFEDTPDGRYEGRVAIPLRLHPKGGSDEFEVTVRFQPCNASECLSPEERRVAGRISRG